MNRQPLKSSLGALLALLIALSCFSFPVLAQDHNNTHANTGDAKADILAVAATQVGYKAPGGKSKYTAVYRAVDPGWSGAFISWCAVEADVRGDVIPRYTSALAMKRYFESENRFQPAVGRGGSYTPSAGDLVFISDPGDTNTLLRAGFVERVNDNAVLTIEGDNEDGVARGIYDRASQRLMGFVSPAYDLNTALFETGLYVTDYALNFRTGPTTDAQIIDLLAPGTTVRVAAVRGNWGKITHGGKTGWICMDYCHLYLEKERTVNWLVADISQWNAPRLFDWTALKQSGVRGVIIRIGGRGYGGSRVMYTDDEFMTHYRAAKAAGLYVGAYFFSYALNAAEARDEANLTLSILQKNNCELDMPLFIDIEDYAESNGTDLKHWKAGKAVCSTVVDTFCSTVEQAGYYAGVYCSKAFALDLLSDYVFTDRGVWIAQYGVAACTYPKPHDMWQYTRYGRINGFSGNIDLSRCYVNFPALIQERKGGGATVQPVSEPERQLPAEENFLEPVYSTAPLSRASFGAHIPAANWETTKAASCTAQGTEVRRCADCKMVLQTRIIPKKDHTESAEQILTGRTDLMPGTVLNAAQLALLRSSDSAMYSTFEATLNTVGGMRLTYCTVCKKVLRAQYVHPACPHPSGRNEIREGSCTADRLQLRVCTACGKTAQASLLTNVPHAVLLPSFEGSSLCTDTRSYATVCSVCGVTVYKEYVAPGVHRYSVVSAVKPLSFTSAGELRVRCDNCGDMKLMTFAPPVYGDLDGDKNVTAADARLALRLSVHLESSDPAKQLAGDIDASGSVDAIDARQILRISVDLEDRDALFRRHYPQESAALQNAAAPSQTGADE